MSAEALGESRRLAPGPSEEESPQRLPPGSAVSRPEGAKGSGHFLSLARRIYRCGWTQVDIRLSPAVLTQSPYLKVRHTWDPLLQYLHLYTSLLQQQNKKLRNPQLSLATRMERWTSLG